MPSCSAKYCNHTSLRDRCRFYAFPSKDEELKKMWIKLCEKEEKPPTKYSVICSCHFVDGLKKNLPTIFSPELRTKTRGNYITRRVHENDTNTERVDRVTTGSGLVQKRVAKPSKTSWFSKRRCNNIKALASVRNAADSTEIKVEKHLESQEWTEIGPIRLTRQNVTGENGPRQNENAYSAMSVKSEPLDYEVREELIIPD